MDWNLRVEVDLTALGLGVRVLNDRGQDGDQAVDDDRWTTTLTVLDTTTGVFSAPVTVVDAFTSTTYETTRRCASTTPHLESSASIWCPIACSAVAQ